MPELPEVDTIRRQLVGGLVGRQVVAAWAHPSAKFSDAPTALGAGIESLTRRGKYLIAGLDDDRELIVHLGMTGSLRIVDGVDEPTDAYVRAWWDLSDGTRLVFRDVRRFGRIAVVPAGDHRSLPTLAALGPEPFDDAFTGDHLWRAVRASDRHLKTQLLSQRPVAGLGNIYADEALWAAGIHPADRSITRARAATLVGTIRDALRSGLDHGGTTLRDYVDADGEAGGNQHHLHCYGRGGEPCERCATPLRRAVLDARTTTWCPACQPRRS
ncbi:MAG: bifunctional DNA-formamidopyrimidine glycosylase/DNA-(apurinic or apyrimidinic site) lyase [Acidimicrobiales bacterium]